MGIAEFIKKIFGRRRTMNISLEELSPLWTRYNQELEEEETCVDAIEEERPASVYAGKISGFVERHVNPYTKVFENQKALDVVRSLLELLEKYGNCSSVVKDKEGMELYSVKDTLGKISLLDHTLLVAEYMVENIKSNYVDFETIIPQGVVAALAHDIGKVPEFRESGIYNTAEHPLVSASKLVELVGSDGPSWIQEVCRAIKDHHISTNDQFTALLKASDRRARETELMGLTAEFSIRRFTEWFSVGEFLRLIEPEINHIQGNNKYKAFTHKGIVYCVPDFLYETAKKLCKDKKIVDMDLVYESEREKVMKRIVSALRGEGYIPDLLPEGRYSCRFIVRSSSGTKRLILTPLRIESFDIEELERRKTGYLKDILEVERRG